MFQLEEELNALDSSQPAADGASFLSRCTPYRAFSVWKRTSLLGPVTELMKFVKALEQDEGYADSAAASSATVVKQEGKVQTSCH